MSNPRGQFEGGGLSTSFIDGCWHHRAPGRESTDTHDEIWRKGNVLGRGTYGTLYLAEGAGGTVRAVKEISKVTTSTEISKRELQVLVKLKSVSLPSVINLARIITNARFR